MTKRKDFDSTIDVMDSEMADILEKLSTMDKNSEEYKLTAENLAMVAQAKQTECKSKGEWLSSLIPDWVKTFGSMAVAGVFGIAVLKEERGGGVISTQALNVWDKFIRRF